MLKKKEIKNQLKSHKYEESIFFLLICVVVCSCDQICDQIRNSFYVDKYNDHVDTVVIDINNETEPQSSNKIEKDTSSWAIGDIYLGINESTFNSKRNQFLVKNPKINGVYIDKMEGKFYEGKLYYITIISQRRTEPVTTFYEEHTQSQLDSINNAYYVWSSLYKRKYSKAKYVKDDYLHHYLLLKRGKCTIEVHDKYVPDYTQKEYEEIVKLRPSPVEFCSYIYFYDENVIKKIQRDKEKQKDAEFRKSIDVI